MSKFLNLVAGTALAGALVATPAFAEKLGLGRTALPEEIAAWDRDVSPDGTGLPVGTGSVEDGEVAFSEHCAICHGEFAEGVDNWPKLPGGAGTFCGGALTVSTNRRASSGVTRTAPTTESVPTMLTVGSVTSTIA